MIEEFLWTEVYRPKTIDDTILPSNLKEVFKSFISQGNIPNLILSGPSGCGKTTVARAMLEELGCDYIMINGSLDGNIDTLRNQIQRFASTVSLTGGRKYVILDEADYLNPQSTQPALRNFIETYSKNCGFILTCNFKNKLLDALRSRCSVVDFKITKKELPQLAYELLNRACSILDDQNVEYNKEVIVEVVKKHCPDWRAVIVELQKYAATGKIDSGILVNFQQVTLKQVIELLKNKDFTGMRKWVGENSDIDATTLYRVLYDHISTYVSQSTLPILILLIGKYQYQHAFCADHEINLACCLTEIMMEAEWK